MRNIVYSLLCAVLGVGLFIGGIAESTDDAVKCGSSEIHPGETCRETKNGATVATRSYEEQKKSDKNSNIFLLLGGPVMAIGGTIWFVSEIRKRRNRRNPMPQSWQPVPQQQFAAQPLAPQPYYPPQQSWPQQQWPQQQWPQQQQQWPQQGQPPNHYR
ncbi:hypothetical protein [Antrihabitans sp. YC2-6]|uniref:hypothetical protein n=1 Tax=Antrihabitans sp. YC2-6 TaxID=2799498 RepID=UPI0018F3F053|nr:hypothetical protein [Antrihabitans sp. YC2-6]MBJ8346115.1 hypothetical protein [Antrihabitans sp. YC2-6]